MAITFNSPEDRFGLQSAGSILADTLLRNSLLEKQNNNQIQRDERANSLLRAQQGALGQTLETFQGDITTPEGQRLFLASLIRNGGDVGQGIELIQNQSTNAINQMRYDPRNKPAPASDLRKLLNKDIAQTVANANKIQSNGENINRLRELSQGLRGLSGYAKGVLGTEEAAEFDAIGLATLEGPVKIFNPVGAIPTQKINLLKTKFAPKSTDLQTTIDGKLNALERVNQAAERKVQKLQGLVEQYGTLDAIPDQELLNYSTESEREIDQFLAQPIKGERSAQSNEKSFEKLPSPKSYKGKRVRDTDTGKTYVSDGSKWSIVR